MANYDFKSLSPWEFEQLTRDLLKVELGLDFESFKSGKDKGIDLRHSEDKSNEIIVQCKNYSGSTFSNLKSNIKHEELKKIKILNPKRYILVTSLGLTPLNKDEISNILGSYLISHSDIISKETLNSWITNNPKIERDYINLWSSSTTVIERILHSGIFNYTEAQKEELKTRLKYYVKNPSFYEAKNILKDQHYCIIAGIPGIGKTTLAEMLLIDYMQDNYEPIRISADIEEAYKTYDPNIKRVYYYDDFLGQTGLDQKLNKNEDQRILDFCRLVKKSSNTLFILTTREYILNQAKETYEKLDKSHFDIKKCVIDISSYMLMDRAKILYNHLYFSSIKSDYIKSIINQESYLNIIKHKSFNPRVIEWMTDLLYISEITPEEYVSAFISRLDNPAELWEHAYNNQLSSHAKNLLLVLSSTPPEVFIDNLKELFKTFRSEFSNRYNLPRTHNEFGLAIKESEGNFIRLDLVSDKQLIKFHNPSIRDYMTFYLSNDLELLKILLSTCKYFDQLTTIWNSFDSLIKNPLINNREIIDIYQEKLIEVIRSKDLRIWLLNVGNKNAYYYRKTNLENRLSFILSIEIPNINNSFLNSITNILDSIFNNLKPTSDWSDIVELLKNMKHNASNYNIDINKYINSVLDILPYNLTQINDYRQLAELYRNHSDSMKKIDNMLDIILDQLNDNIEDELAYIESVDDVPKLEETVDDLANIELIFSSNLQEKIDAIEDIIHDLNSGFHEDKSLTYSEPKKRFDSSNDIQQIHSLFETLQ